MTALNGRLYAVAGRKLGFDTNLGTFEAYGPAPARRWQRLAPVPGKRGGTGAAGSGRLIVSAGGEEFAGTIRTVFGYDVVPGAGSACRICRPRATASESWPSAIECTSLRAERSPASPASAERTSF